MPRPDPACPPARLLSHRRALMLAALLGGMATLPAAAQPVPPARLLHLQASAQRELNQDWLTVNLQAVREGADAATVQAQLKAVLDAALQQARAARGEGLAVRTGGFHLGPRYDNNGRVRGWQGQAELILEGRDSSRIAQLAGQLNGLNIVSVQPSVSRESREKAQAELGAEAIAAFRAKAQAASLAFGQRGYTLHELHLHDGGAPAPTPRPMLRALRMEAAAADAPLPVEAGTSLVSVSVQGSVRLEP